MRLNTSCGIGRKTRRWLLLFVAPRNIDRKERGPATAARLAEKHHDAAIRRKGRAFIVKPRGENAFARPVRLDYADGKLAATLLGKCNVVAPR